MSAAGGPTLSPGARFGPYEIVAKLGAGGMEDATAPIVVVLDWTAEMERP